MNEILDEITPSQPNYNSFKSRVVFIWAGVLFFGLIFKLMHWPGSGVLILLSTGGLTAYAISGMISHKGKDQLNSVIFILACIWILILLWGAVFNGGYPYNFFGLMLFLSVTAVLVLVYEISKYVRKSKVTNKL